MSAHAPTIRQQSAGLPPALETDFRIQEEGTRRRIHQEEAETKRYEAADTSEKRISKRLVFSSTLIALLGILLAAVGYRTYRQLVDKPQVPLEVGEVDIKDVVRSLQQAVEVLKQEWSLCSQTVKEAFARHYLPTLDEHDKPLTDPLGKYLDHADSVLNRALPTGSAPQQTEAEYIAQVKLVEFVCIGAEERLRSLRFMEEMHDYAGIAVPLLSLPETELVPSNQKLTAIGGSSSFQQFLKPFLPQIQQWGVEAESLTTTKEKVPQMLAARLNWYLQMARKEYDVGEYHAKRFADILSLIGIKNGLDDDNLSKLKPLCTDQHEAFFDFSSFAQFLLSKQEQGGVFTPEVFRSIAANWTANGVRIRIQEVRDQLERQIAQNLQARRRAIKHGRRGKAAAREHLYALAVFLI